MSCIKKKYKISLFYSHAISVSKSPSIHWSIPDTSLKPIQGEICYLVLKDACPPMTVCDWEKHKYVCVCAHIMQNRMAIILASSSCSHHCNQFLILFLCYHVPSLFHTDKYTPLFPQYTQTQSLNRPSAIHTPVPGFCSRPREWP